MIYGAGGVGGIIRAFTMFKVVLPCYCPNVWIVPESVDDVDREFWRIKLQCVPGLRSGSDK